MSDQYLNDTTYPTFEIDQLPPELLPFFDFPLRNDASLDDVKRNEMLRLKSGLWDFAYAPNDSAQINQIMNKVANDINLNVYGEEKNTFNLC